MSWDEVKVGDFLKRSKIPIEIEDNKKYKRVTIRIKHNGVSLRDVQVGKKIGTKKQFILKSGQFILSKIDARYGAFGIAGEDVDGAIITGNFWAYDVDKTMVNIEWFNQYTNSPQFYELCERASSGITHRKYLDEGFLLNHRIVIPTLNEQAKIIKKIKRQSATFLELSDEQRHQSEFMEKLRQQILQDAIQGKLVSQNPNDEPASKLLEKIKAEKEKLIKEKNLKKGKPLPPIKEEEIPFDIPKNWVWCRLGELTSVTKLAGFEYTKYIKLQKVGEVPVIRAQNVKPNKILEDNLLYIDKKTSLQLERSALTKSCLLITFIGAGIGEVAIFNKKDRWHLAPNVAKAEPIFKEISLEYLMWFLLSSYGREEFFKIQKATAQPSLSMGTIRIVCIPLPPFPEQKRIVKKIEELLKVCDELEKEVKQNQNLTQQLLQSALKEALEPKVN